MYKIIALSAFISLLLLGCDSSDNKKESAPIENGEESTASVPNDVNNDIAFSVEGGHVFARDGSLSLLVEINNLNNDDALYLSITGEAIDSGLVSVTPTKSVLYPSNNATSLRLKVRNIALNENTDLLLNMTSSSNQQLDITHTINLEQ